MRFDIITIFPELFAPFLSHGVLGRGVREGKIEVNLVNLREFGEGVHRSVDDRPYGGGAGMVMMPIPLHKTLLSIEKEEPYSVVFLTPSGRLFEQNLAKELMQKRQLIIVCGRYEGIDERVIRLWGDLELSIGDYVLSGGEVAALVVLEVIGRMLPGVLGDEYSVQEESFSQGLLEYPHYTRPRVFQGMEVPQVLLSGNHKEIAQWRRKMAIERTKERRPDLLSKATLSPDELSRLNTLEL